MPGRARYVWRQAQLNILLLLIPILMILGAAELIRRGAARWVAPEWSDAVGQAGTLGVGAVVFIVAPLLVRALFSTRRIDDGELRDDLMEVCRRHGVKVRELLVWATDGTMINAAVMGLVAPLRYVLMTDALLETMRRDEVRAVMAHEIGHVRRHHMPWMVLCLVALLAAADWALITPLLWIDARWFEVEASIAPWIELALMTGMVGLILLGFGWVSRRFERQADTFAAQHLSGLGRPDGPDDPAPSIAADAVDSLRSALLTICRMHAIDPKRRSWRHGSIEWRIAYLESIVGRPLQGLPIDRVIRRLKLAAVLCVVAAIGLEGYLLVAARGSAPMTPPPDAADAAVESIEGAAAAEVQTP
jgi:Zn-dependent protease with chaperone function